MRGSERREAEDVPLVGVRAEFRTALRQEIDAARRNASSSAVSLVNGRRIAQVGSAYQYVFSVENALNLPGDTPGELSVPGRGPLGITVISLEGLTITLSVAEDLGAFVPSARLATDLTFLLQKLIARIEDLGDGPNPTGERIRGALPASGQPAEVTSLEDHLNEEQAAAVASALGRDTTFIWGPPGTGKTTTIGAIGRALYLRDRSTLVVSHTNTAVDQALLRIAEGVDPAELARGQVFRVGMARDARLLSDENAELRLETHVERRSAELAAKRDSLIAEREVLVERVLSISRLIDIREWVDEVGDDLDAMGEQLGAIRELDSDTDAERETERQLLTDAQWWEDAGQAAGDAVRQETELAELEARAANLKDALQHLRDELAQSSGELSQAERLLEEAQLVEPLRARARALPTVRIQTSAVEEARNRRMTADVEAGGVRARFTQAQSLYDEAASRGRLARMWRQLPDPEVQQRVVVQCETEWQEAARRREQAESEMQEAEQLLAEVTELERQLKPHTALPSAEEQTWVVWRLQQAVVARQGRVAQSEADLAEAIAEIRGITGQLAAFRTQFGTSPTETEERAHRRAQALAEARRRARDLEGQSRHRRQELESVLRGRLAVLRDWGLTSTADGSAENMVEAIGIAYTAGEEEVAGLTPAELLGERDGANSRIRSIDAEVHEIAEALKRVEEDLIAEARVVATTLTRAYLRDSIQARRFDTVILDEASIAPIPALWMAASLAERNAVVVGDPRQLPPIVLSDKKEAQDWLGRDIFTCAGISSDSDHLVALRRQYRMHPQISAIPNALVYEGRLTNAESCLADGELHGWYQGHEDPVLLIDTGPVGAWVTSVPRGKNASRLNFLSATICVDLAQQLLREDRPKKNGDGSHRILIVSPYRAHASLVRLLLQEQGLQEEVLTGTVHHFQGSEASVVIFDLVNDEPHWRVGMFMPGLSDRNIPLLNVALTRAQRRLVIVGDFDYIEKQARKAFLGGRLIPFLRDQQYRRVSALDVVPAGLSARAAVAQAAVLGGELEPHASRCVVSQEGFYRMLLGDLARARSRVVIYSAFMTQGRLTMLQPSLQAAVQRGIRVYVVTKDLKERKARSDYLFLEQALRSWGVVVVHKRGMHEKLVFIDDDVLWLGSLNPLSHSDTQEIMERRASRTVVEDFAKTLRLGELIAEFRDGIPTCPSGHELVAAEGDREPFYWRCVEDGCYSRDVAEPHPVGGMIWCSAPDCGGTVEYGEWGGKPAWRCVENGRHHRKVMRSHLRLPKMRELVPKRELAKLDRQFGTGPRDHEVALGRQGRLDIGSR